MKYINFDCPSCGQNLETPPTFAGLLIECPACDAVIPVPARSASATAPAKPAAPSAPAASASEKGSTMRIQLPPDSSVPPPPPRKFTIHRGRS